MKIKDFLCNIQSHFPVSHKFNLNALYGGFSKFKLDGDNNCHYSYNLLKYTTAYRISK